MTTGQIIKLIRTDKGMTQQHLADMLGVSCVGVSQWENDKRKPKPETLEKIAQALNVPVSKLYPTHELQLNYPELAKLRARTASGLTLAREHNDKDEILAWERLDSEILDIMDAVRNKVRRGDVESPDYNAELLRMFASLNTKGKKTVLEWVGEFCKIPEYQASKPQQNGQGKEETTQDE